MFQFIIFKNHLSPFLYYIIVIPFNLTLFFNGTQENPSFDSVFERGLVKQKIAANEIVADYQAYHAKTDAKRIDKSVLGYITPVSWYIFWCVSSFEINCLNY